MTKQERLVKEQASENMEKVYEIAMSMGSDYLDYLLDEIKQIPDDEEITLEVGTLKRFIETTLAFQAYVMNDIEKVRNYLQRRELI